MADERRSSAVQPWVDLNVELEGLDIESHPDQDLFLSWLLAGGAVASLLPETCDVHDEPELRVKLRAEEAALWDGERADFARLDDAVDRAGAAIVTSTLMHFVRIVRYRLGRPGSTSPALAASRSASEA